jgi:hypothetical protein
MAFELQELTRGHLEKAKRALDIAIMQADALPPPTYETVLDLDAMVAYDSLAIRFGRAVEVVSNKLFRAIELLETQENAEFVRDRLLKMEKSGIITSAERWMDMRNLRNRIVHDYLPEQMEGIFREILGPFTQELRHTRKLLDNYEARLNATQPT